MANVQWLGRETRKEIWGNGMPEARETHATARPHSFPPRCPPRVVQSAVGGPGNRLFRSAALAVPVERRRPWLPLAPWPFSWSIKPERREGVVQQHSVPPCERAESHILAFGKASKKSCLDPWDGGMEGKTTYPISVPLTGSTGCQIRLTSDLLEPKIPDSALDS
jgi:hypothetical protein